MYYNIGAGTTDERWSKKTYCESRQLKVLKEVCRSLDIIRIVYKRKTLKTFVDACIQQWTSEKAG